VAKLERATRWTAALAEEQNALDLSQLRKALATASPAFREPDPYLNATLLGGALSRYESVPILIRAYDVNRHRQSERRQV
jgi:hypothetical protein